MHVNNIKLFSKRLIAFIFIVFFPIKSWAQLMISPPQGIVRDQIFISTSLEPEWTVTMGYTHLMGKPGKTIDIHVGGSVKLGPTIIADGAWRANFITAADWRMGEQWGTTLASSIYWAHDHNRAGVMQGLGVEFRATPTHYGKKWVKGFDLGWQYTALTHIKHSTEARDTFEERYPDNVDGTEFPKDGWYGSTANRFRLGVAGARKLSDHLALQFSVGSLIALQRQGILMGFSHAQFPFYFESTLKYGW